MSADQAPVVNANATPRIVVVVLPSSDDRTLSGRIRNLEVRGVDKSGWLMDDGSGGFGLVPAMTRKGYKLLEDYYTEERNPEGWANYLDYIKDWQAGKTGESFPLDMLPKRVQAMQNGDPGERPADRWARPKPTTGKTAKGPQ